LRWRAKRRSTASWSPARARSIKLNVDSGRSRGDGGTGPFSGMGKAARNRSEFYQTGLLLAQAEKRRHPPVRVTGLARRKRRNRTSTLSETGVESRIYNGMWRSLVAHLTGGQGVAGSNPVIPINLGLGASPPDPLHALSLAASSARSERVAPFALARVRLPIRT
jgi:hypothetical protein